MARSAHDQVGVQAPDDKDVSHILVYITGYPER
jgi:hypothetical protein